MPANAGCRQNPSEACMFELRHLRYFTAVRKSANSTELRSAFMSIRHHSLERPRYADETVISVVEVRCTTVVGFRRLSCAFGSVQPVQVMRIRSMARSQSGRGSPMTAVPRTAAVRAQSGRRAQQQLRGSQREYAGRTHRQQPQPAIEELIHSTSSCCPPGLTPKPAEPATTYP